MRDRVGSSDEGRRRGLLHLHTCTAPSSGALIRLNPPPPPPLLPQAAHVALMHSAPLPPRGPVHRRAWHAGHDDEAVRQLVAAELLELLLQVGDGSTR
jgi:hypothetical protein